jgi:hypothetical protein
MKSDFAKDMLEIKETYEKEVADLVNEVRKETAEKIADWLDNEKGYCGLGYLIKREFCTEEKDND